MNIPDIKLIKHDVYKDERGSFSENFNVEKFTALIGRNINFIQDNYSISKKNVLRGLHYQLHYPQAKLIQVLQGKIFDVAVDLRTSSPTFGKWVGQILSEENNLQMFIPEGFAHGFLTLSETSHVLYKINAAYNPADEKTLLWSDKTLDIEWPLDQAPILSERDKNAKNLDLSACY